MPYQQASLRLPQSDLEPFSDALMDAGALSVAIEDAAAGTDGEQPIFGEPGMGVQMWHDSVLTALFADGADVAALLAEAAAACGLPETPPCRVEAVPEQDWVRLTQSQFEPIEISEKLWIVPTWHDCPDNNAVHLRLDPGLAFGTGSHPTTRLCLQWLDSELRGGETVLDYGCGSGILAIAALKLGASAAVGVDIDPQAVAAAEANAAQNDVAARFCQPDSLPEQQFDVVLANILANPLRLLAQMLAARTKTGGRIVLSGILAEQAEELSGIYARWFEMNPPIEEQGWVCLSGTKRNDSEQTS